MYLERRMVMLHVFLWILLGVVIVFLFMIWTAAAFNGGYKKGYSDAANELPQRVDGGRTDA